MATNKSAKKGRQSPAMQQFFRAKQEYPDTLLFFRMGDFYELFFEDAVEAAALLDIALTSRGNDEHGVAIPMAGVPYHAASGYVARLIGLGRRVAICEQMADPSQVKGVVPREVVRVVTPSLVVEEDALDARNPSYLAAVHARAEVDACGLAVLELSTAELRATDVGGRAELIAELSRLSPRELLLSPATAELEAELGALLPRCSSRVVSLEQAEQARSDGPFSALLRAARAPSADSDPELTVEPQALSEVTVTACAMALGYAQACQPKVTIPVQRIAPYDPSRQLVLDEAAVRNLELVQTLGGERKGSLLHHLDGTQTAMGARLLRHRLLSPLCEVSAIRRRHDVVERFVESAELRVRLRACLSRVADLERLSTRAALGVATPRDLGAIARSLEAAQQAFDVLSQGLQRIGDDPLCSLVPSDQCAELCELLGSQLVDQPPAVANQGGIFVDSVDPRLAELRELSASGKDVLLRVEAKERERTGISTLRIRYTKVFGYYIEVTKAKLDAVPADYRRKQTVASGERFTTDELESLQAKILNADERLRGLEAHLFEALRSHVGAQAPRLRRIAQMIAAADVQSALADVAHRYGYVRPDVDDSLSLALSSARHPIVERMVAAGEFVPNDVELDVDAARMMIITGPNMAGKSTTMRQVALSVIMAQAGGFVPAQAARIGLVDRIHTRVGASDNVARGQSTFMVEMRETATIMHGATRRSLVVLDEIGRGTSTYDGLSIAWAVAEYLHDVLGCRTMFATHYHELCELAEKRRGVVNFNVAAREFNGDVVFLRKLVPGGANRSYGIAVAKLAGLPPVVLARAKAMLDELEAGPVREPAQPNSPQLDMFAQVPPPRVSPVEATLGALDINQMTPVQALASLAQLQGLLQSQDS